jgi:hypothetical protein
MNNIEKITGHEHIHPRSKADTLDQTFDSKLGFCLQVMREAFLRYFTLPGYTRAVHPKPLARRSGSCVS